MSWLKKPTVMKRIIRANSTAYSRRKRGERTGEASAQLQRGPRASREGEPWPAEVTREVFIYFLDYFN